VQSYICSEMEQELNYSARAVLWCTVAYVIIPTPLFIRQHRIYHNYPQSAVLNLNILEACERLQQKILLAIVTNGN